jgi:hypothetical protein
MKHSFELIYELDCTVGEAVAAYLDAEHYMFLHRAYVPSYEALWQEGTKIAIEQSWRKGPIKFGNSCITEYQPPARFLNYGLKPVPRWMPSIHHLVHTFTDLRYYPTEDQQRTVSHLRIELELPWFMWPFRKLIEEKLKRLKIEKDQEDVEMIARHQQVFGRGNLNSYFRKDVFMLHKDEFVKAFGNKVTAVGKAS